MRKSRNERLFRPVWIDAIYTYPHSTRTETPRRYENLCIFMLGKFFFRSFINKLNFQPQTLLDDIIQRKELKFEMNASICIGGSNDMFKHLDQVYDRILAGVGFVGDFGSEETTDKHLSVMSINQQQPCLRARPKSSLAQARCFYRTTHPNKTTKDGKKSPIAPADAPFCCPCIPLDAEGETRAAPRGSCVRLQLLLLAGTALRPVAPCWRILAS